MAFGNQGFGGRQRRCLVTLLQFAVHVSFGSIGKRNWQKINWMMLEVVLGNPVKEDLMSFIKVN